jgi:DNA-directed RNA polymerase subunit RPC12/RpoP
MTPRPSDHKRFRVSYECSECGHEWSAVYEWPQQDRMPTTASCPECTSTNVIYHGAERVG